MKKSKKQILALALSVLLLFAGMPAVSFAAEETVRASIHVEGPDSTLQMAKDVEVAAGANLLTALKTAVGEENVVTQASAYGDFLTGINGCPDAEGNPAGYWMYYSSPAQVSAGVTADLVEDGATYIFYYQKSIASDAKFSKAFCYTEPGESFEVSLNSSGYDASWNLVTAPLTGAAIIARDVAGNTPAGFAFTEKAQEGHYEVTFPNTGTYYLTAYKGNAENESSITRPYCKVVVAELYDITLVAKDAENNVLNGTSIELRNNKGVLISGSNGAYRLPAGTYNYEAFKWGCEEKSGSIAVNADGEQSIILSPAVQHNVVFETTPQTASVAVTSALYGNVGTTTVGAMSLQDGTYQYTATASGYSPKTANFTVAGTGQAITIKMDVSNAVLTELLQKIAQSYYQKVTDPWYVLGIQTYEAKNPETQYKYTAALKQVFVNNAIEKIIKNDSQDSTVAFYIIALKALGIDATNLVSLNKQAVNGAAVLQGKISTGVDGDAFRLLAYLQDTDYAGAEKVNALIGTLIEAQDDSDGSWSSWGSKSADTTAEAVCALSLAKQKGYAVTEAAITNGAAYIKSCQHSNGSVNGGWGENSNSTAMSMLAMAAVGEDPSAVTKAGSLASLSDGLLLFRTATNDGFGYSDQLFNDYATKQSFLALLADQGTTPGQACHIFDFSGAASGQGVAVAAGETGNNENSGNYTPPAMEAETVTVQFSLKNVSSAFNGYSVTVNKDSTIKDVFRKVMNEKGIEYTISGGNYVSMIQGLSEFDGGVNSGWMYTVNGTHPSMGISGYTVNDGEEIEFHYTSDYTKEQGSSGYKVPEAAAETAVKVSLSATENKATGMASATLSGTTLTEFKKALAEENDGKSKVALINVGVSQTAKGVALSIPEDAAEALLKNENTALRIESALCDLTFDEKAMEAIGAAQGGKGLNLTVAEGDKAKLDEKAKALVGERPVFDFTLQKGDRTVSQFGQGSVDISVPYKLAEGEDPEAVVVYYIDDAGKLEGVRGAYNAKTGKVDFAVTHFSQYAIAYNKVNFVDVSSGEWYAEAVGFVAARGIASGTGAGKFSPDKALTRGEFLVMLLRAYGIAPIEKPTENFVDAGNTYYTNYLAAAKKLEITAGIGNNRFAPERTLTREEMCTLLNRALVVVEGTTASTPKNNVLSVFSDKDNISAYAAESMEILVKQGVLTGNAGKIEPKGKTTRAQMAQVLYRLLSE